MGRQNSLFSVLLLELSVASWTALFALGRSIEPNQRLQSDRPGEHKVQEWDLQTTLVSW